MLLFILLVILILTFVLFLWRNIFKRNYWKDRNIVQLNDVLFGMIFGKHSLSEMYRDIYNDYPNEQHVGIFLGSKPTLLLRNVKDIQAVLASDFESFYSRGFDINENDILGNNLLSISDYNKWKIIRQKVSPIFTSAKLKNMCYIMDKCAQDFVKMVKDNDEMRNKPFNALYTYTVSSIGASVFGIDTQTNSMHSPFLDMSWKVVTPSFTNNLKFLLSNVAPRLFKFLDIKLFGDHEEFFVGAVKQVLKSRRNEKKALHDFIDLCLELQQNGTMKDQSTNFELEPTDEIMAAQAFFFFIAGADTSASTMHFTLLELSRNPDVLEKLHQEIDSVLSSKEKVTYEVIEKLNYLDMVLNEAMRKYPPVGVIYRECTKNTVLPTGNVKIEKGVLVGIPIYAIHRDPEYFSNPDKFDPQRFASENADQFPRFGYLPFGEGKRMCLGPRFARLQVKAGLVYLLRAFTLREKSDEMNFEKSVFALRDPTALYELIPRNLS